MRPETIKLLEENIGGTLDGFNQSKILYEPPTSSVQFSSVQFSLSVVSDSLRPHKSQHARPLRVMEIKTKINKWDVIKLKKLLHNEGH